MALESEAIADIPTQHTTASDTDKIFLEKAGVGGGISKSDFLGATGAEVAFLSGVTSSVQGQLDALSFSGVTALTSGTDETYTTPSGVKSIKVTLMGGGGGGGGLDGRTGSRGCSCAGCAADTVVLFINDPEATYTYTVGAGGVGGSAGDFPGSAGGDTIFNGDSNTATAVGGRGGVGLTSPQSSGAASPVGARGVSAVTGYATSITHRGSDPTPGVTASGSIASYSVSGPSIFGGAVGAIQATDGESGGAFGSGGGATWSTSSGNHAGGDGGDGIILIEEYS